MLSDVSSDLSISRGVEPEKPEIDLNSVRNAVVYDELGNKIRFGDIYKKQKTIICFVRHFLDYTCKEYVEDLAKIPLEYLQEAGVRLVVLGPAPYKFIQGFKKLTGYQYTLYCDPEQLVYKAFNCVVKLDHGNPYKSKHIKSGVLMGVLSSTWRAMRSPNEFQGDVKQQGGAFILGPGDVLHFAHHDQSSSDHMPINNLLTKAGVQQVSFQKDPRIQVL
ncbi:peroxiredoxin-like 2C [Liolophura sinensis]|uniref:peroxiredoxin-like 2C n=1 Tax=Liolophura sinensis TaxID=3198878 RepID=UPI0031584861